MAARGLEIARVSQSVAFGIPEKVLRQDRMPMHLTLCYCPDD
jgi:hypothetical protein